MNERLSLQDLIDLLAKKQGITKKDTEAFLRELIAVVSKNIENNDPVKIKDFGTFKLIKVNARKSVDVNTGEAIEIAAHYKVSFTPDKSLKEIINRPFAHFESVILEDGVSFDNIEKEEIADELEEEDISIDEDVNEDAAIAIPATPSDADNAPVFPLEIEQYGAVEEMPELQAPKEEIPQPVKPVDKAIKEEITEIRDIQPLAEFTDTSDEGDLEYEKKVEEYKQTVRRKRKLVYLGFFIFLILVGFLIGGLYFQEIARYLKKGITNNHTTAVVNKEQPETNIVLDSIPGSRELDSLAALIDAGPSQLKKEDVTEQPKKEDVAKQPINTPPATNINAPLATITIERGSTLRNIALNYYGHKAFCVYIYEENRSKINNINSIPIGTKLVIPSPAKYGINAKDKKSIEIAKEKESKLYREMGL